MVQVTLGRSELLLGVAQLGSFLPDPLDDPRPSQGRRRQVGGVGEGLEVDNLVRIEPDRVDSGSASIGPADFCPAGTGASGFVSDASASSLMSCSMSLMNSPLGTAGHLWGWSASR